MRVLAVDPGSEQSGYVDYDPASRAILEHGVVDNDVLLARCWRDRDPADGPQHLAIEMIAAAGLAGATVYRTCWWIGRLAEAWGTEGYTEVTRSQVRRHLLGGAVGTDALVRAALIARWGGEAVAIGGKGRGKQKTPRGPLHGIASHAWQALAVAVTWSEMHLAAGSRVLVRAEVC